MTAFIHLEYSPLDNITPIRLVVIFVVSEASYFKPELSNASLKVKNFQIWQSGFEAKEIRGNRTVKQKWTTQILSVIFDPRKDGDEYFVCWDQNLVPKKEQAPMKPPDKSAKANKKEKVELANLIREFAESDSLMGRVNNLYMRWADVKADINCNECRSKFKLYWMSQLGPRVNLRVGC